MKIGDTVRFMNAVGGGKITRIDEKTNLVYVEDGDGFEIPTPIRDCVVIGAVSKETNFPRKEVVTASNSAQSATNIKPLTQNKEDYPKATEQLIETPDGDTLRVVLAFFPLEIKQLQDTSYDCYLVNDSNYFLFYNLLICNEGNWKSVANGQIEPNIQEDICTITKDQLNNWEDIRVQLLPYKQKAYTPQKLVDAEIKLNVIRFFKLHSFSENEYFDEPAMIVDIMEAQQKKTFADITPDEIKQALFTKEQPARPRIVKKAASMHPDVLEIDLHIHELVDTTAGMSNADMLLLQVDTFHKILDENKTQKGKKIVFIHGKGEGVLRSEIEKQLRTRYKTYYFQDASFREYGFGATMVTIK
ncbi:MAG: hypothetical protein AUK44_01900 [Porphyromonadaceae bacterium CG2_30_38_12]|nr:MAG: hypothetical protein AUK44_01900 [Porphyromonadaceae bacterium CG2_30_38_12]